MTIDEEWEALAVMLRLQGLSGNDVYSLFNSGSGPCWDLYVKEGIDDRLGQDEYQRRKNLQDQSVRDKHLYNSLFGESIYDGDYA